MANEFNEFPHRLFLERPQTPLPEKAVAQDLPASSENLEPSEIVKDKLNAILMKFTDVSAPQSMAEAGREEQL